MRYGKARLTLSFFHTYGTHKKVAQKILSWIFLMLHSAQTAAGRLHIMPPLRRVLMHLSGVDPFGLAYTV